MNFSIIKSVVESSYPLPIASVFRKTRTMDVRDLGGRHKSLLDLFEVLVKFLCIVVLQELRKTIPNLRSHLPQQEKTLEFLKRPSLGGWVGLLRILNSLKIEPAHSIWADAIKSWYCRTRDESSDRLFALLDEIGGIGFDRKAKTVFAEVCNALVTYRNKQFAHAANLSHEELQRRLPILEELLARLLESAEFLSSMSLVFTNRIEIAENRRWLVHGDHLNGSSFEPCDFISSRQLNLKSLYLFRSISESGSAEPLSLEPFLLFMPNPEEKNRKEIFFYNDAMRTKLEYLSYLSNSFYYHKEIHSDFDELIKLKLQIGKEEDSHINLSLEERAERAREFVKRAEFFQQKNRFEDALEALECAVEYERTASTLLSMAVLENRLSDPAESVLQTLQSVLDMDPDNEEALRLQFQLAQEASPAAKVAPPKTGLAVLTFFHYFCPARIRAYSAIPWVIGATCWYFASAAIELGKGHADIAAAMGLMWLGSAVSIAVVFIGKRIVESLRIPLQLQLDLMNSHEYNLWYDEQLSYMFGNWGTHQSPETFRNLCSWERYYCLGIIPWTLSSMCIAGWLCGIQNLPLEMTIKRGIDIGLFYFFLYPGLRYLVMSTVWLFRFSRLSLKPTLTRLGQGGLRALGPMIRLGLFQYLLVHCTGWSWSLLMSTRKMPAGDIMFMSLSTLGCTLWSVGIPMAIRRAMNESKTKARFAYSDHVEKAFNQFLENPGDATLAPVEWLLKHEVFVDKIGTWPLRRWETIYLIGGTNLVLVLFWNFYVVHYLNLWPSLKAFLHLG